MHAPSDRSIINLFLTLCLCAGNITLMKYVPNQPGHRPTVVGHYWVRYMAPLSGHVHETVVHVYNKKHTMAIIQGAVNGDPPDTVFWDGENVSLEDDRLLAFAGPLPKPEE